MYPILEGVPDDGFGSRTDDEFFLKAGGGIDHNTVVRLIGLKTIMGNNSTFLRKAFNMFCLT